MEIRTEAVMIDRDGQVAELDCRSTFAPSPEPIDRMIRLLGRMRAGMEPPVLPRAPNPGELISGARFEVNIDAQGRHILSLRDPGLGWVSIPLDRKARYALLQMLSD